MTHRILLIEDNELVSQFVVLALKGEGYESELAQDLREAEEKLEQAALYDLVIADCVLPDGHILDLIAKMEGTVTLPPVILTSGYAGGAEIDKAIQERGLPILQKPYELPVLLSTIGEQLSL